MVGNLDVYVCIACVYVGIYTHTHMHIVHVTCIYIYMEVVSCVRKHRETCNFECASASTLTSRYAEPCT